MKLTWLPLTLAVCCGHAKSAVQTTTTTTSTTMPNEELLKSAASQLERLSAFRRTKESQEAAIFRVQPPADNEYQSIPTDARQTEDMFEARKRIDELKATASELLSDPRYRAMMQDRIKRSFISGIASKLIGGVVGAASGASRGIAGLSSSNTPSEYGSYGHSYQTKFDIGDFAKAIINTLIQAIKAIGGGAIAGGGALVKGGGYLVSAKGQIITSAGSAITSLGKSIASSAIIASPKPVYGHPGYSYDHQSPQEPSHDLTYDGPPPSADAYAGPEDAYNNAGHSNYAAPSNDDGVDEQTGILIVKETKPGDGHDDDQPPPPPPPPPPTLSVDESKPSLSALEESFGAPVKGPSGIITKITGIFNSGLPIPSDHDHREEHIDQRQPSSVSNYESGSLPNHQGYFSPPDGQLYDSYGTKLPSYSAQLTDGDTEGHRQPLAYQQLPQLRQPLTFFNDLSSFADYRHQSEPLKIPILQTSGQNTLDHSHDNQLGAFNYYAGGDPPVFHRSSVGHEFHGSQLPIGIPHPNNYQLRNAAPGTTPAILGVWGRISRRTSNPTKKDAISDKGLEFRRSVGFSLLNAKFTRI